MSVAAKQYIQDVKTGKIVVGSLIKLAVKRHLKDLRTGKKRGLYFDEDAANHAIDFIRLLRHTKGKHRGEFFRLQPFQEFLLWCLFGWKRIKTGLRRFTRMYFEVARKNGKSELAAAIAVYCLIADGEQAAEVYTAATKRDQAEIVFKMAKTMVKFLKQDSETIDGLVGIHVNNIHINSQDSKMEPLTADHSKQDGFSPSCGIIDEYHAHGDGGKMLDVIETGMGARECPILNVITTAGFDRESPCHQLRNVMVDVLKGIKNDDSSLVLIYSLDEKDDWENKKMWIKANPAMDVILRSDWMDQQFQKAQNEGAIKEIQFKTKNLNIWTNTISTWIPHRKWIRSGTEWSIDEMRGRRCYGGLDLSTIHDLSCLALFFPKKENERYHRLFVYSYCPEDNIPDRTKNDKAPYEQYEREGWLIGTPGEVIDYDFLEEEILRCATEFDLRFVNYDRYNSHQLVHHMIDEGIKMAPFGQGFRSMSAPTKEFHRMILSREIDHGKNKLLAWCASNVAIRLDPAENVKPDKDKSKERIDPIVAGIMAVGAYMQDEAGKDDNTSVYNHKKLTVI